MPNRCTLGNHMPCAACGTEIKIGSPHQHHVWTSRPNEVLCVDCSAVIVKSSRIVLEALSEVYGDIGARNFEVLIDTDMVRVMVQLPFDMKPSNN